MNTSFSLDKLRDDPNFAQLFAKKAVDIKKNKTDLVEAAKNYQGKYQSEIEAGTRKRNLMLTEGKAKGLKEDEIFNDNKLFIPTKETPILNYLFFLLREEGDHSAAITVLREANDLGRELDVLKEEFDKKYGTATHDDSKSNEDLPNMVSFIYKNIGDENFATIKKLKTLSMSDNQQEAFVAYRKCMEMCKKFSLDFDKIPFNR